MKTEKDPAEKERVDAQKALILDYVKTFTSEAGRRVFKDIRKSFDVIDEDPNPFVVMRALGRKDVVDKIAGMIKTGRSRSAMADLFSQPEDEDYQA